MRSSRIANLSLIFAAVCAVPASSQYMTRQKATISHITKDFSVNDLDNRAWQRAKAISVATYWNGAPVRDGRRFGVRLLWSSSALYVRYELEQTEPLVGGEKPDLSKKTMRLWDRDVGEIFLAPDAKQPRKYLEFEVAPTGEWIDLAIDYTGPEKRTDWDFKSGMESAARIEKGRVVMAMKLPWTAFGVTPKAGDILRGNIFRCVGKDPDRGYLAWSPTMTAEPNFHVPERFAEFKFVK